MAEEVLKDQDQQEAPLNIVALTDDDGREILFNQIDYCRHKGAEYVAMVPMADNPEDLGDIDGQLFIMKVVVKNGENLLYFIEDDAEFEAVADLFIDRLSEVYDIVDDTDPEVEVVE